jgi:TolB protein
VIAGCARLYDGLMHSPQRFAVALAVAAAAATVLSAGAARLPAGTTTQAHATSPQGPAAGAGQARQITHAINDSPSLAPDGRRMVYITVVLGREQLFVRSIDGKDVRQLTHDAADHEDPAWSPDGRTIAFVYLSKQAERIAIMPAGGGPMRFVSPVTERAIHPNWAPDSGSIAYCTDDDLKPPKKNDADIKIVEVRTGKVRVLITGGVNTYPAWSPDGRSIAFRRMLGEMNSEVFVADADGQNARNLTNHLAFDGWPSWSPDGRLIAFASNRNGDYSTPRGDYQIFVMRSDGSDVRLVAPTTGRATAPQWSRDGRTVYFPICWGIDGGFDCQIYAAPVPPR